jgi:hypothetical protein
MRQWNVESCSKNLVNILSALLIPILVDKVLID